MTPRHYRALVVDDEAVVRQLTLRALTREGFSCDVAADGAEAQSLADRNRYDVVLTDLRMPNRHGHALATELLDREDRPAVVVLTGLAEPRLAKDLMARGVDDILFKPIDYALLAAKLRVLVERRSADPRAAPLRPVSLDEFERALAGAAEILPITDATLEISQRAFSAEADLAKLTELAAANAPLVAEILRQAQSTVWGEADPSSVELPAAIQRIGSKRLGELALSLDALRALTASRPPWMDSPLAARRSHAAGLALDAMIAAGKHQSIRDGLFLLTALGGMGRVVLGRLFPEQYESMIAAARGDERSLLSHEAHALPENHAIVLSRIIEGWNLPPAASQPLRHILDDFGAVAELDEPMRAKVELIKAAIFLGQLAIPRWEPWDVVEPPPWTVLNRLRITDPAGILRTVRASLDERPDLPAAGASEPRPHAAAAPPREIVYCLFSTEPFDFIDELLPALGITIRETLLELPRVSRPTLVNAIGILPDKLATQVAPAAQDKLVIIANAAHAHGCRELGRVVSLPGSFSAMRAACLRIAR